MNIGAAVIEQDALLYLDDQIGVFYDQAWAPSSPTPENHDQICELYVTVEDCVNNERPLNETLALARDLPAIRQALIAHGFTINESEPGIDTSRNLTVDYQRMWQAVYA